MSFTSIDFLIFFPVVCSVYYMLPQKLKNFWLLICSYIFYMWWNISYSILMLGTTVSTFICGIGIKVIKKKFLKKYILVITIILNLGVLFFFKYFNFSFATFDKFLRWIGAKPTGIYMDLLLPLGISFYTFKVIGYVIDVYKGMIEAETNIIDYAVFVSFFPMISCGPIERASRLLRQLKEKHFIKSENICIGSWQILYGFFQKVVIADRISIYVDYIYTNLDVYKGLYIVIATILFALQIYCDFNGCTYIARGTAKILGFDLINNFDVPYLALTITEFWRKWHVSLTSWFRDYLYIPLGGNRKGKIRKYLNTLTVFLCSGLWHGAAWGYIVWGALNGIYIVLEEMSLPIRRWLSEKFNIQCTAISHRILKRMVTFVLVDFAWIFFRAESLGDARKAIRNIFVDFNPEILFDGSINEIWIAQSEILFLFICIIFLFIIDYLKSKQISILMLIQKQGTWFRVLIFSTLLFIVFLLGIYGIEYDSSKFIYVQF